MQATQLPLFSFKRILIIIVALAAVTGCGSPYSEDDKSGFDKTISSYITKKNWKMTRTLSGLYYEITQEGTGEELIQSQSVVKISYKGTLLNGSVIDQTEPGKPLESPVKGLIRGFQEVLVGKSIGSKLHLVLPPQLGYGDTALDKIPANSILVFDLEVVEVH